MKIKTVKRFMFRDITNRVRAIKMLYTKSLVFSQLPEFNLFKY